MALQYNKKKVKYTFNSLTVNDFGILYVDAPTLIPDRLYVTIGPTHIP